LTPTAAMGELNNKKGLLYGDIVDVICTNYTESYLEKYHEKWPEKACISGEAYHYWRRKRKDESDVLYPPKPRHSDYTKHNPWFVIKEHEYTCGIFLWTGMEYLGEVRDPYPYHGRTNAPISIDGYLKPQALWFQSQWKEEPIVNIVVLDEKADIPRGKIHFDFPKVLDHWNFEGREGEIMKVFTYTNCETVRLLFNGDLVGELESSGSLNNEMEWNIPYKKGTLEAIGMNSGKDVVRNILKTTGPVETITFEPDRTFLEPNGISCLNVEISARDAEGLIVKTDTSRIELSIEGPIQIIGLDNGNLSDHTPYVSSTTKLFRGTALAVFQSKFDTGKAIIRLKCGDTIQSEIEVLLESD
jgi:beta-galactosidase